MDTYMQPYTEPCKLQDLFFDSDISNLVIKQLNYKSKAALRLVNKAAKAAVDTTIRKVDHKCTDETTEADVNALLNVDWNLEELEMFFQNGPADTPLPLLLLAGIKHWPNLKKVSIFNEHGEYPIEEKFRSIVLDDSFVSSTTLEVLEVPLMGLTDNNNVKKLAGLRWASNLKSLNLTNNDIGPESLVYIAQMSSSLTKLNLGTNSYIQRSRRWHLIAKDLGCEGFAPLTALRNLVDLDLNETGWQGQGFGHLIKSLTSLEVLDVSKNDLSNVQSHLSELALPRLKILILDSCSLPATFFASTHIAMPALESLSLIGNNSLTTRGVIEGFDKQRFPSLKSLGLDRCWVSGQGLAFIVAAGAWLCPQLEKLTLVNNKELRLLGIHALANNPWQLKRVWLQNCGLGKEEIKALAGGNFRLLETLYLHGNPDLDAEALLPLANANMRELKHLGLAGTAVSHPGIVEIDLLNIFQLIHGFRHS